MEPNMKMKILFPAAVVAQLIVVIALASVTQSDRQDRGVDDRVGDRFVGAWRLAWLEQQSADGKVHRTDCCGMLVFTRDGHVSVQVMEHEPQSQTPAGPDQYSQGGYEASYGRYDVSESAHTFTFHVEGALVRTLVGKDLPRAYEFSGKQLIVKSTRADEHWRVAWEHY
jgi:lipocalin-like protein